MISPSNRVVKDEQREIGYAIRPASKPEHHQTAILWFYPLGGCSTSVDSAAASLDGYECSVISVDRPSIGDTDPLLSQPEAEDPFLHRIQRHADDVLTVLAHEGITEVYLLAVCLGHPYALQVARRLMQSQHQTELKGITLVAPFVSTACPQSWSVARLGSYVPSFVLRGATNTITSIERLAISIALSESAIKKIVTVEEREHFGWTDDDFKELVEAVLVNSQHARHAKATEAQLGASPVWQSICDEFAVESGCGLNVDGTDDCEHGDDVSPTIMTKAPTGFPLSIHACRKDKIVPLAAVQFLTKRCFGNVELTIHEEIHSHEIMTILGGPLRSPGLLHEIARTWKLVAPTTST